MHWKHFTPSVRGLAKRESTLKMELKKEGRRKTVAMGLSERDKQKARGCSSPPNAGLMVWMRACPFPSGMVGKITYARKDERGGSRGVR